AEPASQRISEAIEAGCTQVRVSACGMALRFAGVSMVPGRIAFAVIPRSLFSAATVRINETNAAFEALYAATIGPGLSAARLAIAMILPLPACRMCGITARKT